MGNIYVSPSGNDAGSGTPEAPYKTISRAAVQSAPGDVVHVAEGIYHEEVRITNSGTAENPISFVAEGLVEIDGRAGLSGPNEGLPGGAFAQQAGQDIVSDIGLKFKYAPMVSIEGDNIQFKGFVVKRSLGRGIRIYKPGNLPIKNTLIEGCTIEDVRQTSIMLYNGPDGVKVKDCVISKSNMFAPYPRSGKVLNWGAAFSSRGAKNIEVTGTLFREVWGEGFIADGNVGRSSNILVDGCVFEDIWRMPLYAHAASNVKFTNNLMYMTSDSKVPNITGLLGGSLEGQLSGDIPLEDVEFSGNISVGHNGNFAVWNNANREVIRLKVFNNTFVNSGKSALVRIGSSDRFVDCEFYDNTVYQENGDFSYRSWPGWKFYRNKWSSKPTDSFLLGVGDIYDARLVNPNAERVSGEVQRFWYMPAGTPDPVPPPPPPVPEPVFITNVEVVLTYSDGTEKRVAVD